MTNITHEHLDYHGSFKNYLEAKRKMFKMANSNKRGMRAGVINADDESAGLFAKSITNPLLYGIDQGELRARDVKNTPKGVSYKAELESKNYNINCQIPGTFNVYNSLAAVGVGHILGLSEKQIEAGIADKSRAHLVCYNTTYLERNLALRLGIPLYGADPCHLEFGTKTGCRKLFAKAGINHPLGFDNLHSIEEVVTALLELDLNQRELRTQARSLHFWSRPE
jgi:hypothetical protein